MRTIWIDPQGGKHYRKPSKMDADGRTYAPPTDEQLTANGWQIEQIIDPIPQPYTPTYEERVVALIRERYDLDSELAILRQRDTKPTEYAEYFAYCEECKERARV